MAEDTVPTDIPVSDAADTPRAGPAVNFPGIRRMAPIDADIWERQRKLGRVTPADEAVLQESRLRIPWMTINFVLSVGGPVYYGRFYRQPPWSRWRIAGWSVVMGIIGAATGGLAEAYGNINVIRRCPHPQSVNLALQESTYIQRARDMAKIRGIYDPVKEAAAIKRLDQEERRTGMDRITVRKSDSEIEAGWDDASSSGGAGGRVAQELESQSQARRWDVGEERAPRPPRPSPRSAETNTSPALAPASETDETRESAWEALRHGRLPARPQKQKQERTVGGFSTPDSETGDTPSYDTPIGLDDFEQRASGDDAERQKAQKEFDEMLEKERRFGMREPRRRSSGKEGTW